MILGAAGSGTDAIRPMSGGGSAEQVVLPAGTGVRWVGRMPGSDRSVSGVGMALVDGAADSVVTPSAATGTPSLVLAHADSRHDSASTAHAARFISPCFA